MIHSRDGNKSIEINKRKSFQIQDKFEEAPEPLKPVRLGNLRVVKELEDRCSIARNPKARELFRILRNPHFKVRNSRQSKQEIFNFFSFILVVNLFTRSSGRKRLQETQKSR